MLKFIVLKIPVAKSLNKSPEICSRDLGQVGMWVFSPAHGLVNRTEWVEAALKTERELMK